MSAAASSAANTPDRAQTAATVPAGGAHEAILIGNAVRQHARDPIVGSLVDRDGDRCYCIANYDRMPPFLMSLVGDADQWLFISSNGALTAGRRDPDHALFPYATDDRIHDSDDVTGSKTLVLVNRTPVGSLQPAAAGVVPAQPASGRSAQPEASGRSLWEPFSQRQDGLYAVSRRLFKGVHGNSVVFEEINDDLSLAFSYGWQLSARFGFVRRATLANLSDTPVEIDLLDGMQNLLPPGIGYRFQLELSTLADGYKEAELEPATGLGIIKLGSIPSDRAEPSEALSASTVWCSGLNPATRLLSATQLDRFREGQPLQEETAVRGRRGAYFVNARLLLPPKGRKEWLIVADVDQDAGDVAATLHLLGAHQDDAWTQIEADISRGTEHLVRIVAGADGLQLGEDEPSTRRHYYNALFNVMRGGIPDQAYWISSADLFAFLARANGEVLRRHARLLETLPATVHRRTLLAQVRDTGDPDLERLAYEYLPLTFSRRHGDPSRPWNWFSIAIAGAHGEKILSYEGNWRDIFQNWEALGLSYPSYLESMIVKFVNACTADGYNPYRVTRDGFDWEVPSRDEAWANIGYWGDHQIIYLLKLLETSVQHHPGEIAGMLSRRVFAYANVPYRLKPYAALLRDPHATIRFDAQLDRRIRQHVAATGADGALLRDSRGEPARANLAEKLLVLSLAKLFNYVPEAGIWMNTQRPEWNDANNALVGNGVSVVTVCYLRRFLCFCRDLFATAGVGDVDISTEVAEALRRVAEALDQYAPLLDHGFADRDRKAVLDKLGAAGSAYRAGIYAAGFSGTTTPIPTGELQRYCDLAVRHLEHCIRANRRDDGLYHAYNLVHGLRDKQLGIRRLQEMLEGQVAALSSGMLTVQEAVDLLDALRSSRLYRADQDSYLLYPDRLLPGFLVKNVIPEAEWSTSQLLVRLVQSGDPRIVTRDVDGRVHFNAALRNRAALEKALTALPRDEWGDLVARDRALTVDLYERLFDHHSFTGRAGTFFKYEGLGCVYWHMVSKLLLAVHEIRELALCTAADETLVARLNHHYRAIREGIGVHKTPEQYGAVPLEPYSHTPGFAGVQQPGMTGQVKEDLISRRGELGVAVAQGRLSFRPDLVDAAELLRQPCTFEYYDVDGQRCRLDLEAGTLAYTVCQTPIVLHRSEHTRIEVTVQDGSRSSRSTLELDRDTSAAVFERTGEVRRLDIYSPLRHLDAAPMQ